MDRAAVVVVLAMAASGCARDQLSLPPSPMRPPEPAPAEAAPSEPIPTSINQGKIPSDLSTVRASHTVESPGPAAEPDPAAEPPSQQPSPSPPPPALPPRAGLADPPAQTPGPDAAPSSGSSDAIPLRIGTGLDPGKPAARTAAIVGGTVITYRELKAALCHNLNCKPHDLEQIPRDQLNQMAKDTLDHLIDRALLLQEARKGMKKPQQWAMFREYVEKSWHEHEIPPMLKKERVEDEFALARTLEARGESLDDLKTTFLETTMARQLMMMRVQEKVEQPGLPELQEYYAKHRDDPAFHREAQVKWHEVLLAARTPAERAAARKKADALRARLLAGETFEAIARAESAGATASKGGAWETTPEAYAVPAVNAALATLPPGQISAPIEGPKGVHLVRVTSRRQSGAASFVEVQGEIATKLFQQRYSAQVEAYLKKLRDSTSISSPLFEGTATAPTAVQEKGKTDAAATRASGP